MISGARACGLDEEDVELVQRILNLSREPLRVLVEREEKTLDRVFGFVIWGPQASISVIPVEQREVLLEAIDPEVRQKIAEAIDHSLSEPPAGRLRTVVITPNRLFNAVVQLYVGGLA